MRKLRWVGCCAFVALACHALFPNANAQEENPFEFAGAEGGVVAAEPTPGGPGGGGMEMGMGRGMVAVKSPTEFCHCVGQDGGQAVANIKQALVAPLRSSGLEFVDTPLSDVVASLQDEYSIPIQLDAVALEETGIRPDEPVSINLHNISLQSALRLMLRTLNLTYVIKDEVLMITTPNEAEKQLITCVYDVRDLIDGGNDAGGLKALVDTVLSTIHSDTWAVKGGEAEIRPLKPGLLVISQTHAVHEQVRGLLNGIRQMRERPAVGVAAKAANGKSAPDADKVVTRYYMLQTNSVDQNDLRKQVRNLITQALQDEQWDGRLEDGQPVVLAVLPDRVVLRQTQAVQEKVRSLLVESGLATPGAGASGMMGMGGGFGGGGRAFGLPGFHIQEGEFGGGYSSEGSEFTGTGAAGSTGVNPSE